MNVLSIEAFLAIVETGNISAASEKLFLSQSTVSHRLKLLEEQLGIQLLVRNKGHRIIQLTSYGKEFISIAERWLSLWKDTQNLKSRHIYNDIAIGSVDSLNNHTFVPLYQKIVEKEPKINLQINTHHSSEIHTLLENRVIDIGFVFSQIHHNNIITKPIYSEKMYLLCNKSCNYYDNIKTKFLLKKNEIYLKWGLDYQQWHDSHWDPDEKSFITVNTGSMLYNYLNKKDAWAVAPLSIIKSIERFKDVACYSISDSPPDQKCYQLIHRYPKASHINGIEIFLEYLDDYINTCDWINKY
ncbi:hypothetical protein Ccar_13935 [Clostridium carboxidivorans P7]|uniref:Transcriptional regulator, LysR family n=1 Tax=Clostridium carboxidivorans P7 TaxID=536227 RepID=C6PS53_9CLOT|nr:LysR family transcriptional regulator [Clostridium carboxidivorans]AKN31899.1 hypothetical protein Ccar_13935 [Clostridium carboxidivorans P7]EET87978.1 transcriptional regulator, LysR family [Clostridium carboxidivorans P7]